MFTLPVCEATKCHFGFSISINTEMTLRRLPNRTWITETWFYEYGLTFGAE